MKRFTSKTQKIGEYGEKICKKYLLSKKHKILEENYTIKEGEIDIISQLDEVIHFIEVKSVSYETSSSFKRANYYNPAENVTKDKIRKCFKTIRSYLNNCNVSYETSYQFDVYLVYIDRKDVKHRIEVIENVF